MLTNDPSIGLAMGILLIICTCIFGLFFTLYGIAYQPTQVSETEQTVEEQITVTEQVIEKNSTDENSCAVPGIAMLCMDVFIMAFILLFHNDVNKHFKNSYKVLSSEICKLRERLCHSNL